MSINVDNLKFADVFVDFIDNDRIVNSPANLEFRYNHISKEFNDYKTRWKNYLSDKYDELEDRYDEWYDNLEFDLISYDELSKYRLPLEKFKLEFNDLSYFLEIAEYYKKVYDKISHSITDNNIFLIQIDIGKLGIMFECLILNTKDANTRKIVKSQAKNASDRTWELLNNLNKVNPYISYDVNLITASNNSYTKTDKNSPKDENKEKLNYKEIFNTNNISYFKRLQLTPSSFRWAKGKSLDYDLEEYLEKVFKNIPNYHKCNNEELADRLLSLI